MTNVKLEVRNVSWGVPDNPSILTNISFKVHLGEILGIVGPNGSGKSTLLRLIYRYLKPKEGIILVDDKDIWSIDAKSVAREIAVVLQESFTDFPLTVREIISLGRLPFQRQSALNGADSSRIDVILERLKLKHLASRKINLLSGGERQMVMVARALVQEPTILILDEPTNHLDIRHKLEILSLIQDLSITTICTLHDLNSAANLVDKILILDQGKKIGFGSYEETLTPTVFSNTYAVKSYKNFLDPDRSLHYSFQL